MNRVVQQGGDPPTVDTAARQVTFDQALPERAPVRAGLVLAAACLCQLMVALDISVVNVALPSIGGALGFTRASLSWVVSAYTLTFGGLLLLGGRLADVLGHRRTMLGALSLFGVASLLGGLAQGPGQLIAARAVQGVAAAVLSPVTLTVLMLNFPEGPQRRRAVATWGMVATAGGALGVLIGGVLTQWLDWRWVLFVNVPLVVAAIAFVLAAVRDASSVQRVRLDVPGAILATTSMTLLAYGFVHAGETDWGTASTVAALGAAVLAGLAFVARETYAEAPLIRLSVMSSRPVWTATVIIGLIGATAVAGFYFLSLFLQNVLGYDPLVAGLAFLPFCAGMAGATMASPRLVERFETRHVLAAGLTVAAVGMVGFARLDVGVGYGTFLLASIPVALGLGACIAPTLALGTSGALQREAGMVSGLLNASRQTGGSLALAVLTTVATRSSADAGHGLHALAHGYRVAFLLSSALLLAAAAIAYAGVPRAARRTRTVRRGVRLTGGLAVVAAAVALLGGGAYAALAGANGSYIDLGWAGSVRLEIAGAPRERIFVGVAAPAAVAPLGWTAHAEGAGTQTLRWSADDGRQIAFAMNADRSRRVGVRVVSSAITLGRMPWWVPTGLLVLGTALLATGVAVLRAMHTNS